MSKSTPVIVGATEVRAYARTLPQFAGAAFLNGSDEKPTRGRLPKAAIEAYEAAHPGHVYEAGHKVETTFVLTARKTGAKGRTNSRKVTKTRAEVLALAGEATNRKGVLSTAILERAEAALDERTPKVEA
jgi:hypothetical protein